MAERRDAEWWKTYGAKHTGLRKDLPSTGTTRGLPSHKAQPSENLLRYSIKNHILAMGPISFGEIRRYVHEQVPGKVEDYKIVGVMNNLAKQGVIELYDDGSTWNVATGYRG